MILVDSSAFIATIDHRDIKHTKARKCWISLVEQDMPMICNSYILLETFALLQKRQGFMAVNDFQKDVVPILQIEWLTEKEHLTAIESLLNINRRRLSLVDCAAFATMRRLGIQQVFTFDRHFAEQGFEVLPKAGD